MRAATAVFLRRSGAAEWRADYPLEQLRLRLATRELGLSVIFSGDRSPRDDAAVALHERSSGARSSASTVALNGAVATALLPL